MDIEILIKVLNNTYNGVRYSYSHEEDNKIFFKYYSKEYHIKIISMYYFDISNNIFISNSAFTEDEFIDKVNNYYLILKRKNKLKNIRYE